MASNFLSHTCVLVFNRFSSFLISFSCRGKSNKHKLENRCVFTLGNEFKELEGEREYKQ